MPNGFGRTTNVVRIRSSEMPEFDVPEEPEE